MSDRAVKEMELCSVVEELRVTYESSDIRIWKVYKQRELRVYESGFG